MILKARLILDHVSRNKGDKVLYYYTGYPNIYHTWNPTMLGTNIEVKTK